MNNRFVAIGGLTCALLRAVYKQLLTCTVCMRHAYTVSCGQDCMRMVNQVYGTRADMHARAGARMHTYVRPYIHTSIQQHDTIHTCAHTLNAHDCQQMHALATPMLCSPVLCACHGETCSASLPHARVRELVLRPRLLRDPGPLPRCRRRGETRGAARVRGLLRGAAARQPTALSNPAAARPGSDESDARPAACSGGLRDHFGGNRGTTGPLRRSQTGRHTAGPVRRLRVPLRALPTQLPLRRLHRLEGPRPGPQEREAGGGERGP